MDTFDAQLLGGCWLVCGWWGGERRGVRCSNCRGAESVAGFGARTVVGRRASRGSVLELLWGGERRGVRCSNCRGAESVAGSGARTVVGRRASHGPVRVRLERPRNRAQPDVRRWPCPQTRRSRRRQALRAGHVRFGLGQGHRRPSGTQACAEGRCGRHGRSRTRTGPAPTIWPHEYLHPRWFCTHDMVARIFAPALVLHP